MRDYETVRHVLRYLLFFGGLLLLADAQGITTAVAVGAIACALEK